MLTYLIIHGVLCVAVLFVSLNKIRKLEKSAKLLSEEIAKQKTLFIESGNAITATLKIAFDNIKILNHGQDRIKKEIKENEAKTNRRTIVNQEQTPNFRTVANRHVRGKVKEEKSE
jgi:uncharacterized protein YnzC (UPF0291/DUF896 family)